MADYVTDVQKLYVAYFSRPGDPEGVAFWTNQMATNPAAYQNISAAFSTSAEYRAAYANMNNRAVVTEVYDNLFGRAAEQAGIDFWADKLDRNIISIDNMVTTIAAGAQGSDLFAYNAKVATATVFTQHIDTPAEKAAYSGDAALKIAVDYIATIKDLQSAAMGNDPGNIDAAIARMSGTPTGMDEIQVVGLPEDGGW